MSDKKKMFRLLGIILAESIFILFVVWLFDPFYQYHAPFWGEAVLNDRDNQMPGSIRNLSYDSVLLGSSVAENYDSGYLDVVYDCNTLKIIKASGSTADLCYYLDMAQEEQELKNVFWSVDMFALNAAPEPTAYEEGELSYLHTETILDDNAYIYNKDILFDTIPTMLVFGAQGRNVGGDAYNWARDKEFSAAKTMQAYAKPDTVLEPQGFSEKKEQILINLELITAQLEAHPDTNYRFIFPAYSMIWWDCAYVNGQKEEWFYVLEQALSVLTAYENAEVYYYQDEEEIISNLDNYMDMIHYSPAVNQYMLEQMYAGEGRVTADNWEDVVVGMRELTQRIQDELIYRYYPE